MKDFQLEKLTLIDAEKAAEVAPTEANSLFDVAKKMTAELNQAQSLFSRQQRAIESLTMQHQRTCKEVEVLQKKLDNSQQNNLQEIERAVSAERQSLLQKFWQRKSAHNALADRYRKALEYIRSIRLLQRSLKQKVARLTAQKDDLKKTCAENVRSHKDLFENRELNYKTKIGWMENQKTELEQRLQRERVLVEQEKTSFASLKELLNSQSHKLDIANAQIRELSSTNTASETNIRNSSEKHYRTQQILKKVDEQVRQFQIENDKLKRQNKLLSDQIDSKSGQAREAEYLYQEVASQNQAVLNLRDENRQLKSNQSQINKQEQDLQKREKRLASYSRSLDSEKQRLKNHALKIAKQIQNAQTVNPLNGYLSMTQQEISKLESTMAKLPAYASGRQDAEGTYDELIQQRTMISEIINKTNQELHGQAKAVLQLLNCDELEALPPLPPK